MDVADAHLDQLFLIMVSFLVVFRELAIVRKSLLINKDGIFRRDRGDTAIPSQSAGLLVPNKEKNSGRIGGGASYKTLLIDADHCTTWERNHVAEFGSKQ